MITRTIDGKLILISRSTFAVEQNYNNKLYISKIPYVEKYKSVIINPPKFNKPEYISEPNDEQFD